MQVRRRPRLAMVELTNHCNLRCVMCGIWEERPKRVFDMGVFEGLLRERSLRNVPVLALTGGEPFLLKNFGGYYARARALSPRSHINVSTNGYYTDRTLAFLEEADRRRTSLTISYDGVRSHDAIRRVEGSQERLLATARAVRRRFPELRLSLKLTVTNENSGEILDTARQCEALGVPFRMKTLEKLQCHQSRFPSEIDGPEYDESILRSITEQAEAVLALGIETNREYIRRLTRKNGRGTEPCTCSPRVVFVGIDGKVFLCRKRDPIGNVLERPFDAIWRSGEKRETARAMAACPGSPLGLAFLHE